MANLVGTTMAGASISAFKVASYTPQHDVGGNLLQPTVSPDGDGSADVNGNYSLTVPTIEAYWILSEWPDGEIRLWQQSSESGTTNFDPGVPTD